MKRNALILSAGLALLTASVAHAQESGRLSADYLKQATPLIHWPQGLEPRNVDVFVHNEGWIDAPPEHRLGKPDRRCAMAELVFELGRRSHRRRPIQARQGCQLQLEDVRFPIRSTVDVFEPGREIGWSVDNPEFKVHHAWVLVPSAAGRASSLRKHKRVLMRSSSGLSSRTRCTMAMTGGCLR
jgi:hypothetical protein